MKTAVIFTTYHKSNNFGGLLQAYALQTKLLELGVNAIDIDYIAPIYKECDKKNTLLTKIKNRVNNGEGNIISILCFLLFKQIYKGIYGKSIGRQINNRNLKFKDFRENNLKHTSETYTDNNLTELDKFADLFITGSDLVWNLGTKDETLFKGFWLDFDSNKPKISYAASAPMRTISEFQVKEIKRITNDYQAISLREDVGYELFKTKINPDCPFLQVVDPVFLLTAKKWECFAEPLSGVPSRYVLTYMLGDNPEYRKFVKNVSKEMGIKLVCISHVNYFCKDDIGLGFDAIDISPMNFVWLFQNADMIITDSFHGAAFSSIFDKKFYVLDRYQYKEGNTLNDRLYSLLRLTENEYRLLNGKKASDLYREYEKIKDVENTKSIRLKEMIEKSEQFLCEYCI